ncbi:MAG: hypothetical protein R3257_06320, partial [bacterium]|nr:hypothetical protein [bacterium]
LRLSPPEQSARALELLHNFFNKLTPYNRRRVLGFLFSKDFKSIMENLGPEYLLDHLQFYVTLFDGGSRRGFSLLEGVTEAFRLELLPKEISKEEPRLTHFIEQTQGFLPSLYRSYQSEGDALFERLEKEAHLVLKDEFGLEDAQRILAMEGEEFLLAVLQKASPTSGASFIKNSEELDLLKKTLEAGDLRDHLPPQWKERMGKFWVPEWGRRLRPGEALDPNGKMNDWVEQLRSAQGEPKISEPQLQEALEDYLGSARTRKDLSKFHDFLLIYAAQKEGLGEGLPPYGEEPYRVLALLEEIFARDHPFVQTLQKALDAVPHEQLANRGRKQSLMGNARGLAEKLKKTWVMMEEQGLPWKKRREILARMITRYPAEDVEKKILHRTDLDPSLRKILQEVLHHPSELRRNAAMKEILSPLLTLLRTEKNKFDRRQLGEVLIGLRAVKGPGFGLWGLNAGVCTADDIALWENRSFVPMAVMTSQRRKDPAAGFDSEMVFSQVEGYIITWETKVGGEKYLILPGINPSVELLSRIDSSQLYGELMEKMIDFAQAGGFHGVYIPEDRYIHSNRTDIQRAIQSAGYPVKEIPEVQWNSSPKPYPFSRVYVVWEREGF